MVRKDDYELLMGYLRGGHFNHGRDRHNAEELQDELKKAKVISQEAFPADVVRLNSKVRIQEYGTDKVIELLVVTPDKANISERKISVFAPIGTALIGFRQGAKVKWQVPAGVKTFTILLVENE